MPMFVWLTQDLSNRSRVCLTKRELDNQLYTALLHTESNKIKDLIRSSNEYNQILITSQRDPSPFTNKI